MADANDSDFLGEGTAARQATAAPLTREQIEAQDAARRARILRMSMDANSVRRQSYTANRTQSDREAQALSNRTVIDERIARTGSPMGNRGSLMQNLSRDPVTAGVLLAPYGVLGAGAALGGLSAAGTTYGGSALAGSAGQAAGIPAMGAPATIASPFAAGTAGAGSTGVAGAAGGAAAAAAPYGFREGLRDAAGVAGLGLAGAGLYQSQTQGGVNYVPPAPVSDATQQRAAQSAAQGGAYSAQINDSVQRALNAANSYTQGPAQAPRAAAAQTLAAAPPQVAGRQLADTFGLRTTPGQSRMNQAALPAQVPGYDFASTAAAPQQAQPNYQAQGQQAAARQAPQIRESGAGLAAQQSALAGAQAFRPDTSGIQGILNARADTSGAAALTGFQGDMAGINRLDSYQPSNANAGISNVENYQTDNAGIQRLDSYNPTNANTGIRNLENFNPQGAIQGAVDLQQFNPAQGLAQAAMLNDFEATRSFQSAEDLKRFQADGATEALVGLRSFQPDRSGIQDLRDYARAPEGPSAAEQLLAAQSDKDIRSAIAIARSGRGGPAAIAQAQRQAQSEGAAIAAETRGQGAALRAQETEAFKQRQLAALSQAGVLISSADAQVLQNKMAQGQILSAADAQKLSAYQAAAQQITAGEQMGLQAKVSAGQLISAAEAQKLQAKVAAGQLLSEADQMKLAGFQSAGQLRSTQDSQLLSAAQSAGQLRLGADQVRMSGLQSGLQARSTQDQQLLGAATAAGQLRAQNDATRVQALTAGGQMLLQGSEINQRGQIAATNAQLTASGQQLQSLALQGQISSDIRNADINVLTANLSANLQQLNLNDTQVRAFAQMDLDRQNASQRAQLDAARLGIDAAQVQSAIDLGWQSFAQDQLTAEQQYQLQVAGLKQGLAISNQNAESRRTDQLIQTGGSLLAASGRAASDERAKTNFRPIKGREIAQALRDSPASEYEYTEPTKPGRAPGRHVGPMAQGLQKSRLFAPAVSEQQDGTLQVDGTRLALGLHAAVSHLQSEMDLLKKHRKTKRSQEARA